MAGAFSACPQNESALDQATRRGGLSAASTLSGMGIVRLLQGAVFLHAAALVFAALLHPISLPSLAIIVTGLVVALVALRVPQLVASPVEDVSVQARHVPPTADLSPAQVGSGASPSPLPFIGERIALDPEAAERTGLAFAAARLSRMVKVQSHPLSDLFARVSHELRTPLNAVIGFSDVMESELLGPVGHPRYREYARHIRDCGRDLLKSAEDTLAITCLLDHDPTAEIVPADDFRAMVDEAWSFFAGSVSGSGLSLDADIPDGLEILVDRRPMRQILINLFAEALRRTDARGAVGLVVTMDGDLAQIEIYLRGRPGDVSFGQASLPICLARALLELHGATLIELDDPYSTWRAVTALRCTPRDDLFISSEPSFAATRSACLAEPALC